MKKKGLLGILAVLMVFALALTGCGQQGEQNAGATGSEDGNGEVMNTEPGENVNAEPENGGSNTETVVDNRNPEIKDGYYIYEVLGEEFHCKTNVWDYIDEDAKTFDFGGMKKDLGVYDGKYTTGRYRLRSPFLVAGNVSDVNFNVIAYTDDSLSDVDRESERLYIIKYSSGSSACGEYVSKSDSLYGFTLDLIVLTAYGCENIKQDLSSPPLGEHLLSYYNEQQMTYELP
ncbi:MAG: hypothetical protein ACI4VS_03730 [Candidatus Nanosyncoccaceae bacterium]